MPRCADESCGRWRPKLSRLDGLAADVARPWSAIQFNERWYCSRGCVEQAALRGLVQSASVTTTTGAYRPLKLGVLLRHSGAISQAQLEMALGASALSGFRLGHQLVQLGFVTPDMVLRALATQAGVSYLSTFDVRRVARSPVALPASMVRALGLVPFEWERSTKQVQVVCAAPLPRAAMRAFARLTGWTPEVFLVTDDDFKAAINAYRPGADATTPHDAMTVGTIGAAAARVADAAAQTRGVTMRHAAYGDRVWVRVEGTQRVSDLIVTGDRQEAPCRAELTAH